jgi:hypothetical protein
VLGPDVVKVTVWVPLAAKAPLQAPDAVHDVALIVDHVRVVEPRSATVGAASDMAGTASAVVA